MSEAKHTPGPWQSNGWRVGTVQMPLKIICDTGNNAKTRNAENAANALLIAAAPELLEACELMLAVYAPYFSPTEVTDSFSSAVIKARAAIAKARGAV